MTSRRSPVEAARRLVLRTSGGMLGRVSRLAYEVVARVAAVALARRYRATVFVRGAGARHRFVPGLSDIDLLAIAPPSVPLPEPPRPRWLGGLVQADIYRADDFEAIVGTTATTFGLGTFASAYCGARPPEDPTGLLDRPGIPIQPEGWRHLAGRRPALRSLSVDRQLLREAAWCEITAWWRFALQAIHRAQPHPSDAYLCVKLVSEPLRALLALDGRRVSGRREALELGASLAPGLAGEIEATSRLLSSLHLSPEAPFDATLPVLVALSEMVAERIGDELPEGERVRLGAVPAAGPGMPLADWRALVAEPLPGKHLVVRRGSVTTVAGLREASYRFEDDVSVLEGGPLLFQPTGDVWFTGRARVLQARFSDPVSFALLSGSPAATFAGVRGWSARDTARRAVAERGAWLRAAGGPQGEPDAWPRPPDAAGASGDVAGHLLATARVALFSLSLSADEPVLLLDPGEVAEATGPDAVATLVRLEAGEAPEPGEIGRFRGNVLELLDRAREALRGG